MSGKFGLGKGLADLRAEMGQIPDISILTNVERVVVKQIPIAQIGANPDQPRKTFTETELSELAASIKEKGVLQPILLRTVTGRPYMYEIVAGERRYRASKMAGLSEIPALVKTLNDENAMEIALIENVQRENLNPIEEAAAYQNIMEKCGYELSDVSRLIGKSARGPGCKYSKAGAARNKKPRIRIKDNRRRHTRRTGGPTKIRIRCRGKTGRAPRRRRADCIAVRNTRPDAGTD